MILGMDFLTKTQPNIDVPSAIITLYNGLANLVNPNEALLRTMDAVLITPKSEAIVPIITLQRFGSV